jgi:glucose/arabinose dehydrogenase
MHSSIFNVSSRSVILTALALVLFTGVLQSARAAIPNNVTSRNFFGTTLFTRPIHVEEIPGKDSVFVVLEQYSGQVLILRYANGAWTKSVFDTVVFTGTVTSNRELGLLGMAFHPNFSQNRKYYLIYTPNYTNGAAITARATVVERRADTSFTKRDTAVASRVVLAVPGVGATQIGGHIAFGRVDGYLYVGLGDGGGTGDPGLRAKNIDSLQGKIIRINVDSLEAGKQYAIPADNPFAGQTGNRREVWAYGIRHPWRWTFHPTNDSMWMADLGVDAQDEISLVVKGGNHGWNTVEGTTCYSPVSGCVTTGFVIPAYTRSTSQSLIGGVFFRGQTSGQFHDTYIFGNNSGGQIWGMRLVNGAVADQPVQIATMANVSSFGKDARGRILVVRLGTSGTGQNINANTGLVSVLESPDMVLSGSTSVRRSPSGKRMDSARYRAPIRATDLLRQPERYEVRAADGRLLNARSDRMTGVVWARTAGGTDPLQAVTVLP